MLFTERLALAPPETALKSMKQNTNTEAAETDQTTDSPAVVQQRLVLPPVLDACCGSRMFWFDKGDDRALFIDEREETHDLDKRKGRAKTIIAPDIVADFRDLPFPAECFSLVVFDPPHLLEISEKSRLAKKYGRLMSDWRDEIKEGFSECFRVLKPNGTLIFKWSEAHIPIPEVLALTPSKPLFGNQAIGISNKVPKGSTHWIVFLKQSAK